MSLCQNTTNLPRPGLKHPPSILLVIPTESADTNDFSLPIPAPCTSGCPVLPECRRTLGLRRLCRDCRSSRIQLRAASTLSFGRERRSRSVDLGRPASGASLTVIRSDAKPARAQTADMMRVHMRQELLEDRYLPAAGRAFATSARHVVRRGGNRRARATGIGDHTECRMRPVGLCGPSRADDACG